MSDGSVRPPPAARHCAATREKDIYWQREQLPRGDGWVTQGSASQKTPKLGGGPPQDIKHHRAQIARL